MTDVELIIKIPEELYKDIKAHGLCGYSSDREIVSGAIVNGEPLPKGHGRLKDTDAICKDIISALGVRDENYLLEAEKVIYKRIKNANAIIEADAESEEKEEQG